MWLNILMFEAGLGAIQIHSAFVYNLLTHVNNKINGTFSFTYTFVIVLLYNGALIFKKLIVLIEQKI